MNENNCKCARPAGSIHGRCNRCRGRLPQPVKGQPEQKVRGWTGSKVRGPAQKLKKK